MVELTEVVRLPGHPAGQEPLNVRAPQVHPGGEDSMSGHGFVADGRIHPGLVRPAAPSQLGPDRVRRLQAVVVERLGQNSGAVPDAAAASSSACNAGASGQLIDGPAKLTPAHNGAGTLNASTVSTPPNDEPATANPPGVYPGPRRDPLHRGQHVAEARGRPMTDRPKGRKICLVDCVLLLEVATDLVRGSLTV